MGGPSRNINRDGVVNDDWKVTVGGDGFWVAIDPVDENIVFTESQYGNAALWDKKSEESVSIRPVPRKGEKNLSLVLGYTYCYKSSSERKNLYGCK